METKDLDIVYLVRRGDHNPELRHSLRSLKNMPHSRVFIFGHKPPFISDKVIYIHYGQFHSPMENTVRMMFKACSNINVSGNFILMHDDFFIMNKIDHIDQKHRGTYQSIISGYSEVKKRGLFVRRMIETKEYLESNGFNDPLCYELHMPHIINKTQFIKLQAIPRIERLNKLSIYGNFNDLGGCKTKDVKVSIGSRIPEGDFSSTLESTFDKIPLGKLIQKRFAKKCQYEV